MNKINSQNVKEMKCSYFYFPYQAEKYNYTPSEFKFPRLLS